MGRSPEYRIIRWDGQLVRLRRNGSITRTAKGEAVERLIGVEITTEVSTTSGKQITYRGHLVQDGRSSSECDLIFRDDWGGGKVGEPVKGDDAICVIEAKSDLKLTDIDDINDKVEELRGFTNAPILVAGIRHDNTMEEIRSRSVADETVAFGALNEAGSQSAEKMVQNTRYEEFDRLANAVEEAVRTFEKRKMGAD